LSAKSLVEAGANVQEALAAFEDSHETVNPRAIELLKRIAAKQQ